MLPTAISPSQLRQGFQQRTAMPSRLRVRLSRHRHPSLYREQILSARKEGRMKIELEKPPEQRAAFQRRMQCQTRQLPWQPPARLQLAHFLLRESFLRFQPHTNSARLTQSPRFGFYPLRGQISRAWPRRNNIGSSRYRFEGAYLLCRHACYILLAPIRSHGGNSKHPECASRAAHQQVGSNCSEDSHRKTQNTHNHHSSYRKNTRIAGSHRAVSIRFPRRPLATV